MIRPSDSLDMWQRLEHDFYNGVEIRFSDDERRKLENRLVELYEMDASDIEVVGYRARLADMNDEQLAFECAIEGVI